MDDIAIATLWREMREDCRVAREAFETASSRLAENSASGADACGHHLSRLFNVIEQLARRVANAFENHIDERGGWHAELIRRMTLDIGGVRPALFPREFVAPLQELRGFRHVFTHAYDLETDPEKLRLVLSKAGEVTPKLESECARFIAEAAAMHSLRSPV